MKKLVYVIDDDEVMLHFLETHFELLGGFEVKMFRKAAEAMEVLGKRPDLIILDHDLNEPDKTGLDYLRIIKRKNKDSMVVYLSGIDDPTIAEKARVLGASEFIAKNDATLVRLRVILDWISGQPIRSGFFNRLFRKQQYLSLTYN